MLRGRKYRIFLNKLWFDKGRVAIGNLKVQK